MATTLEQRKVVAVAQVEKMGEKLIIPDKMTTKQAIETLQRFEAAQEEVVNILRTYEVFPWDGAYAIDKVLTEKYGWSNVSGTPGWFGPNPPQLMPVEIGYKKTVQVPWGQFALPGIQGTLETGVTTKRGMMVFQLSASVKRKFEGEVKALFDQIGAYLEEHSIYRGQAVEIDFDAVNDEGLIEPKFMNVEIDPDSLVLNDNVREDVENVIFTPIVRGAELPRHGIPFRSMVVLAGPYGTGKTLTSTVAAFYAVKHGVFYLKVKKASHLVKAIEFARQYENPNGAVIQVEDIDRVTSGSRTEALDDILNKVDGVDSKTSKIMVIATTNAVETINPAALRNGRVRKVIFFTAPDARSVEKLIRQYGAGSVAHDTDLTEAGRILAGTKPATIADVVGLSKLAMLKRVPEGTRKLEISGEAIAAVARTMEAQLALVDKDTKLEPVPTLDAALRAVVAQELSNGHALVKANGETLKFKVSGGDNIAFKPAA